MSKWGPHAICRQCWEARYAERTPVTLNYKGEPQNCCFCGQMTDAQIYIRHDGKELLCKGECDS